MRIILETGVAPPGTPKERSVSLPGPVTLQRLLEHLAPEIPLIARQLETAAANEQRPSLLILRNESWVQPEDELDEDDVIEIHPPIAGG